MKSRCGTLSESGNVIRGKQTEISQLFVKLTRFSESRSNVQWTLRRPSCREGEKKWFFFPSLFLSTDLVQHFWPTERNSLAVETGFTPVGTGRQIAENSKFNEIVERRGFDRNTEDIRAVVNRLSRLCRYTLPIYPWQIKLLTNPTKLPLLTAPLGGHYALQIVNRGVWIVELYHC